MTSDAITSEGQITIPKAVRDKLGLQAGDKVDFYEAHGDIHLRKDGREESPENGVPGSADHAESPFRKWDGFLGKSDKTPDEIVEEMRGR